MHLQSRWSRSKFGLIVALCVLSVIVALGQAPQPVTNVQVNAKLSGGIDLTCDDSSATTTSAGLNTFLDGITSGGASANAPRVLCLTASTITLTSQVSWTVPDHVVLLGAGSLSTQGGGGTTTTFVDNFNPSPGGNCGSSCDTLQFSDIDGYFRFAGFTYQGPNGNTIRDNAPIVLSGTSTQVRLDHFTYSASAATDQVHWMYIGGCLRGVIDHSDWTLPNDIAWIHFVNGSCSGDSPGNYVWSQATNFGSSDFFFVEDSTWTVPSSAIVSLGTMTDCHSGGKFVIRFSTVTNASIGQTHATIHSNDDRGCRAHEIYGNRTEDDSNGSNDPSFSLTTDLSGGAIVWGNDWENGVYERAIEVSDCRTGTQCGYTPTATPNNWGPCGTAYSGTGSNWDRNDDSSGYACIDQAGRGQGDLITGTFPSKINNVSGKISWPNQVLEPVYEWLNTGTTTGTYFRVNSGPYVQNRDYYVYRSNSSCNQGAGSCTAGVGSGTLAQRPANCTTGSETGGGVAWWATDQGSWNQSTSNPKGAQQNGIDGVLYRCSATNTWTVHYTPYTYPHPLNVN